MLLRWRRKSIRICGQALILAFLFVLAYQALWHARTSDLNDQQSDSQSKSGRPRNPFIKEQAAFWRSLFTILLNNVPQTDSPPEGVPVPHVLDALFDPEHDSPRPDVLWMKPNDVSSLKKTHATAIQAFRNEPPKMVFQPGTRGIALTAGISQMPVLLTSLKMLRRTGCKLPIEVFLASSSDYDREVCEGVLQSLDARCVVFYDIVLAAGTGVALEHFQFKSVALLFSSFENVLLLDSDAFPVEDPTYLFEAEPFSSTGMVLWPDFWYPTESPYFFEITGLGTPPARNTRPATESGEMLFCKSKHSATLLLSAYYNYYGPLYFYSLLSQGAPGQGDKETFPWAARVMNASFYLVHTPVLALGHVDSSGSFFGSAMAQHDPVADFGLHKDTYGGPSQRPQLATFSDNAPHDGRHTVKPIFIHANFPKFDPAEIFLPYGSVGGLIGPVRDSNGTLMRAWYDAADSTALFGYDVEAVFWKEILDVACSYRWKEEKYDTCSKTREYVAFVFGLE